MELPKLIKKEDLFGGEQTIFVTPEDYEKMIEENNYGK